MQSIADNLRDPSWWFTAFVAGTVASLAAGLLQGYLEARFKLFWASSREKRERARLRRQERIDAWSQSESRVIIVLLEALLSTVLMLWVGSLAVGHVNYLRLRYGIGGLGVKAVQTLSTWQAFWLAAAWLFWLWLVWKTMRHIVFTAACVRQFCRSKDLPPPLP